jgi:hypothetical protein
MPNNATFGPPEAEMMRSPASSQSASPDARKRRFDWAGSDGCPALVTRPAVRTAAGEGIACAAEDSASNPGPFRIGHLRPFRQISPLRYVRHNRLGRDGVR